METIWVSMVRKVDGPNAVRRNYEVTPEACLSEARKLRRLARPGTMKLIIIGRGHGDATGRTIVEWSE